MKRLTTSGNLFGLLICVIDLTTSFALLCLSCKQVFDVNKCFTMEKCATNQKCYSTLGMASNGSLTFDLGCIDENTCNNQAQIAVGKRDTIQTFDTIGEQRRTNIHACLQCCSNANGCNINLCGAAKKPVPRCMKCKDSLELKHCNTVTECSRDEFCFIQRAIDPVTREKRYQMGCMGYKQCDALESTSPSDCTTCCNSTDYCNYAACDHWAASTSVRTTHQPHTTSHTTIRTTSKPVQISTTLPPDLHVVVTGPSYSSYGSHVEIKFSFMPRPQSYVCKLNGSTSLPHGVTIHKTEKPLSGEVTIIVDELNTHTMGKFSCRGSIDMRYIEKSFNLEIKSARPTAELTKVVSSSSLLLTCHVTGYPLPVVTWDFIPAGFGAHGIPPGVLYRNESTLYIAQYLPISHNGAWTCTARNRYGTVVQTIQVP